MSRDYAKRQNCRPEGTGKCTQKYLSVDFQQCFLIQSFAITKCFVEKSPEVVEIPQSKIKRNSLEQDYLREWIGCEQS